MLATIRSLALVLGAAAVLAFASSATADDKDVKKAPDFANLTDMDFASMAAAAGVAEVNLSQLALTRATRPDVKQFAQKMVADHGKANTQLMQVATTKNLRLPEGMDAKHQAIADQLSKLNGADFDRAYVAAMLKDHETAVKLFEAESRNGKIPELKAFATSTLPELKEHLELVRKLAGMEGTNK